MNKNMNILHTSDWHLGRTLYGRKRYEEFTAFLDWLATTIEQEHIDTLLIAGDIFDTTAPSNQAQALYYRFLCRVCSDSSPCRHIVITAGNHDSPSFLNAPRELLKAFNVHVIGNITDNPDDEIVTLHDPAGNPELIVCAVPYLRDRDIRIAEAGESVDDKDHKLVEGVRDHYETIAQRARVRQQEYQAAHKTQLPIIAMGHLFAAGGKTIDDDGVRELYVGSLGHLGANTFSEHFDYVALGHLHVPQIVDSNETIRYSGSPLPMGFGEASQQKVLCKLRVQHADIAIQSICVPNFQHLEQIKGNWESIEQQLTDLRTNHPNAWVEVIYTGDEVIGDLRERIDNLINHTDIEVLRVKNTRLFDQVMKQSYTEETLQDLNAYDVFDRCLSTHQVPDDQRQALLHAYHEVVQGVLEDDSTREKSENSRLFSTP